MSECECMWEKGQRIKIKIEMEMVLLLLYLYTINRENVILLKEACRFSQSFFPFLPSACILSHIRITSQHSALETNGIKIKQTSKRKIELKIKMKIENYCTFLRYIIIYHSYKNNKNKNFFN